MISGCADGQVCVWDLRGTRPLTVVDVFNGAGMVALASHPQTDLIAWY